MKIAIFSDSHAGSLKSGWEDLQNDYTDIEITFFAGAGKLMSALEISEKGYITSSKDKLLKSLSYTSGSKLDVSVNDFDVVFVYGLGVKLFYFRGLFYSSSFLSHALNELSRKSLNWTVMEKISSIFKGALYVGHSPMLADKDYSEPVCDKYKIGMELMNKYVYAPRDVMFFSQPVKTIVDNFHTDYIYSKGSEKLDTGSTIVNNFHDFDDMSHMNKLYGKIYLKEFLDFLILKEVD